LVAVAVPLVAVAVPAKRGEAHRFLVFDKASGAIQKAKMRPPKSWKEFDLADRAARRAAGLENADVDGRYDILSEIYSKALNEELTKAFPEFSTIRRILRNAGRYRIRSVLSPVLQSFDKLLPLVREVILYLLKILTKDLAEEYEKTFRQIIDNPRSQLPFVNTWLSALLEHPAFNAIGLPENYEKVRTIRDRALIAIRRKDRTWVKGYKNAVDTLGPWEKRAVLYSSIILSDDEKRAWMRISVQRGDRLEVAVSKFAMVT
jgi:hypothetical protein